MKGHGEKFTRKQEAAIVALVTCRTMEEAAKSIGVCVKTLIRWKKLPEFAAALRKAQRAAAAETNTRFQQARGAIVANMIRLAIDPKIPPAVQLNAGKFAIEQGDKPSVEDLEARVADLEKMAKDLKGSSSLEF